MHKEEPSIDIGIAEDCALWRQRLPEVDALLGTVTEAVLEASFLEDFRGDVEVSFALVDDVFIRQLNDRYRHKDTPTNVLSFPIHDHLRDRPKLLRGGPVLALGDVVLAFETIAREADEQKKSLSAHVQHMVAHGVLHLLGYDHESEADAEEMEALEVRVLKTLGVLNPYENT